MLGLVEVEELSGMHLRKSFSFSQPRREVRVDEESVSFDGQSLVGGSPSED